MLFVLEISKFESSVFIGFSLFLVYIYLVVKRIFILMYIQIFNQLMPKND